MNNRKREILGLNPKKQTLIRKRKTEPKELPEVNSSGWRNWAEWKDENADAVGAVRMKRPPVPVKLNAKRIAKLRKIAAEKELKADIRMQKKLAHALNAGKREAVKLMRKENKMRLSNGLG